MSPTSAGHDQYSLSDRCLSTANRHREARPSCIIAAQHSACSGAAGGITAWFPGSPAACPCPALTLQMRTVSGDGGVLSPGGRAVSSRSPGTTSSHWDTHSRPFLGLSLRRDWPCVPSHLVKEKVGFRQQGYPLWVQSGASSWPSLPPREP